MRSECDTLRACILPVIRWYVAEKRALLAIISDRFHLNGHISNILGIDHRGVFLTRLVVTIYTYILQTAQLQSVVKELGRTFLVIARSRTVPS